MKAEGPHRSVLLNEVVAGLALKTGCVIVDGTVGAGGHAEAILERIGASGRLVGFDKDPAALAEARKRLAQYGERVMLIHEDFQHIPEKMAEMKISTDGVLLDLGVSSMQLDDPARGFSFRSEGPLDMRMDPRNPLTAARIVNDYPKERLLEILWNFGEERFARKIVHRILNERRVRKIQTTSELASVIVQAVPPSYRHGRIHPATRTFQALRIEVNREIESLEKLLPRLLDSLNAGACIVIISFHSLEDRVVKRSFRDFQKAGRGVCVTKKPVVPGHGEMEDNPRSRSAKLRVFEKSPKEIL